MVQARDCQAFPVHLILLFLSFFVSNEPLVRISNIPVPTFFSLPLQTLTYLWQTPQHHSETSSYFSLIQVWFLIVANITTNSSGTAKSQFPFRPSRKQPPKLSSHRPHLQTKPYVWTVAIMERRNIPVQFTVTVCFFS